MGRYTKGIDLYKAQKKMFEKLALDRRAGHIKMVEGMLKDAKDLTSGTLTPKQTRGAFARLRNADGSANAFGARRGTVAQAPLLPINMQSHRLNESFYIVSNFGNGIKFQDLQQENPGGGVFRLMPGGTRKMVDSGYKDEIRRRWSARNKAYLDYYRAQQRKGG